MTARRFTINDFHPMPVRIGGELEERVEMGKAALAYQNAFLDDCLRGILPHDLVLIGAPTGMGKTDLALAIATANADAGRRVMYFALEAERIELERRTLFSLLSRKAHNARHPKVAELNYADWYLGRCEHIVAEFYERTKIDILHRFGSLRTFYRDEKFDAGDLANAIRTIHEHVDLIVVDHLHYIDAADEDTHEAKALGDTVKTIRDVSLRIGKPIILIAHLRKREARNRPIVASLDDFHGSSNVVKICTQVIALEHATSLEPPAWYLSPTFVSVLKDRRAGAPRLVAAMQYDKRARGYQGTYTLGRLTNGNTVWEELPPDDVPTWAKKHRTLEPRQLGPQGEAQMPMGGVQ